MLVQLLKRAMGGELASVGWMDVPTRARAEEKLDAILDEIGYPDRWADMSTLEVSRESWPANAERAARFELDRRLENVGKPTGRGGWRLTVPAIDVSYCPERNSLTVPAGILLSPFFDLVSDDAPNFGAIGSLIGRQLTHGFDEHGSNFDADGGPKRWWSEWTAAEFAKRAGCAETPPAPYLASDGRHAGGVRSRGEEIAELGGLKIAYLAFENAVEGIRSRMPSRLQGFTPEQRFFLGFAQSRCGTMEEERSPASREAYVGRLPVNGPLSHMKEFAEAFSCPKDAPMFRPTAETCGIW
jgi:predicted metalloendopeptidase